MRHEPGRLIGHTERPMDLVGADALWDEHIRNVAVSHLERPILECSKTVPTVTENC